MFWAAYHGNGRELSSRTVLSGDIRVYNGRVVWSSLRRLQNVEDAATASPPVSLAVLGNPRHPNGALEHTEKL